MSDKPFEIGFLLFPNLTQLDLTGPYEVLSALPGSRTHLVWKDRSPVAAGGGLQLVPSATFADCPQLDLICVPGGVGVSAVMEDADALAFVRRQAAGARYVTSVCTGALVLGAAGLLRGKRATTHWMSRRFLPNFGAIRVDERVVRDGNLFTGGGVTAGIDFGLVVAAEVAGPEVAQAIQLRIEYAPAPPFDSGSPERAPKPLVERLETLSAERMKSLDALTRRVGAAAS
ncbi:MAG: DJ-1/PfpI family protein [Alphaproteobacteria bacterium]|nr:DJ-1/PfpI family protein [Alphaproteobacteria bacterium]